MAETGHDHKFVKFYNRWKPLRRLEAQAPPALPGSRLLQTGLGIGKEESP